MPRWAALVVGLAFILLLALILLWFQRKPIAQGFVDRELTRSGVPARYRIADLGPWGQRLTDVVIGDPAHPDLVADWVELETAVGFSGIEVRAVRAGQVRMRGRLVDGKLSLGAIDRLMPASSGKPFALPDLEASIADGRMRLETPWGVVGLKLSGEGRLSDDFTGRAAAISDAMEFGGCRVGQATARFAVRIQEGRPDIAGPVRAARLTCPQIEAEGLAATLDATLNERFDRWRGSMDAQVGRARSDGVAATRLAGSVTFDGGPARTTGSADLRAASARLPQLAASGVALSGRYRVGTGGTGFDGALTADRARLSPATSGQLVNLAAGAAGTPLEQIAQGIAGAGVAAGNSFALSGDVALSLSGGAGEIAVSQADLTAATGARVVLSGGQGLRYRWPDAGMMIDGQVALSGGGLPQGVVRLAQAAPGAPVVGSAILRPYQVGRSRIALDQLSFRAGAAGDTRFATRLTLSGPLGDGWIERLSLPIAGNWRGNRLAINAECVPAAFAGLRVSSLNLGATRTRLCPLDGALVAMRDGRISGGARVSNVRLAGTLGGTPLALAASDAQFRIADSGFRLAGVAARLGAPGSVTRIDADRIEGSVNDTGVGGRFAGGAGQIGNVPLLLSRAAGDWRLADGRLTLAGHVAVDDAAEQPRFTTMVSDDLRFTLAGSDIAASGTLRAEQAGTRVADARITHHLGTGRGEALLDVPGIAFAEQGLQPDNLTRLTYGVIADVDGTISGGARIAWSPEGVDSTGTFRTSGTDLAAAFGPVKGLSGEIAFTDLLNLKTAPGQVVTLAEVNPGIPALDGVVRYQLVGGQRVQIEGGKWPFAGGALVLRPTLLDFNEDMARRMTFAVEGIQAALFLQEMDFDNIDATGVFDGELPMIFDNLGARIEGGSLVARPGGGTIAYIGEVTKEDLGFWGNAAFQALRSLRYRNLALGMNGPLAGEMLTEIRFAGVSQGEGTKSNFLIDRLAKLPFIFNIRVRAPFRQLIDSVQSYYDPKRLIERNLPALIRQQAQRDAEAAAADGRETVTTPDKPAIQAPESETMP